MWTTIKLKQDCCRIVFKQLAVRNRRLLSLWQVFTHPKKYKIVNWNIVGKSVRVSQACPDFPLEAMPSFAINNHIFNLVQGLCTGNTAKGPAAQLRYMSTNQKCELKKSIYVKFSSIQGPVWREMRENMHMISWDHIVWQVWFHIIASLRLWSWIFSHGGRSLRGHKPVSSSSGSTPESQPSPGDS